VIPTANLVTTGTGLPWWSTAVRQWLAWAVIVPAAAIAVACLATEATQQFLAAADRLLFLPSRRTFALLVALLTTGLALATGWWLFGLHAVVGDEFAQRWQAMLLASGHLSARAELHPEFFSTVETLTVNGRWFAQFPIGGPLLLAAGAIAHAAWLVNPLLAGVAALAFYDFLSHTTDERVARIAALLFAVCPWVLMMAGSEMNHVGALALVWIALASLARWSGAGTGRQRAVAAAAIGLSLGAAATIRPFDAAVAAACIGLFQLREVVVRPALRRSPLVELAAMSIPVALLLYANHATVGSAFTFAYDVLNGPEHRPGFHMTPLGFEHTPRRALYMASAYLMKLDVGLFAWPVPAMALVAGGLWLLRGATRWDLLLVGFAAALLLGYACYWSENYFVGPRFLFVLAPVFVLYTARFPMTLMSRLGTLRTRIAAALLVPVWLLVSWAAPIREFQLYGVRQLASLYRMHAVGPAILRAIGDAQIHHAVVFVQEGLHGRLTARLGALGMRPLAAEQLVSHADACTLIHSIAEAEIMPDPRSGQQLEVVARAVVADVEAMPLNLPPAEQIALVQARAPDAECGRELETLRGNGASLAELMLFERVDASGVLDGDVVFARDFGARNGVLRQRFPDRAWYGARVERRGEEIDVRLLPFN